MLFCLFVLRTYSVISNSVSLWTIAHQTPLFMSLPQQEYWSGCHFVLQGIFPTQGLNLYLLCWQADSLTTVPSGKPVHSIMSL